MSTTERGLRRLVTTGVRDGTFKPGGKLPTERDLVSVLEAPRHEVRRALAVLENEGLIVRQVGRGTYLADESMTKVDGAPADTSPAETIQVRLLLEPQIAEVAARMATQTDLDRIVECLRAGNACDDFEGFEEWDGRLHRSIVQATHNGLLMNVYGVLETARALPMWGTRKKHTSTPERRLQYKREHSAIVDALRDRDPANACRQMKLHLQTVADNLLG